MSREERREHHLTSTRDVLGMGKQKANDETKKMNCQRQAERQYSHLVIQFSHCTDSKEKKIQQRVKLSSN